MSYAARYKGTDGFAPLGPWLVTRDEIPDPGVLDVTCKVGAEVVAEDSTRYLTYSVPEILAFLSRFQTLEPETSFPWAQRSGSRPAPRCPLP